MKMKPMDSAMAHRMLSQKDDEIERLTLWIRRIDNINDDPARFSPEIDQACIDALAGKPMIGNITSDRRRPPEA